MKRLLLAAIAVLTVFAGCKKDEEEITSIEIAEGQTVYLEVLDTKQLHIKHYPEHLTAPSLYKCKWTSSNTAVAVVRAGEVDAEGTGEAEITVTTPNNISASCHIIVKPISLTGIKLSKTNCELLIGESLQLSNYISLSPIVSSEYKQYYNVKYSSSDEDVAKVDENGTIETMGAGECQVKAYSFPDGKYSAICNIKVLPLTLNNTMCETIIGEQLQLQPVAIADIYKDKLVYTSSNETVAKVNNNGTIETVGVGECIITATSPDGKAKADCKVIVWTGEVTSITLNQTELTLIKDESFKFEVTIEPKIVVDQNITWTTSNDSVAFINADGTLIALNIGECTITAISSNAEVTAECKVKVIPVPVTGLELTKTSANILIGSTETLQANVLPTNAGNKNVIWSSSNESVATVDNGIVTGVAAGTATISATTEDGGFQQSCNVTVGDITCFLSSYNSNVSSIWDSRGTHNELSCRIKNESNEIIILKSVQVVNSTTHEAVSSSINTDNAEVWPGHNKGYTLTGTWSGTDLIVKWTIELLNGNSYSVFSEPSNSAVLFGW